MRKFFIQRIKPASIITFSIKNVGAGWPAVSIFDDFAFVELKVARQFVTGCTGDRRKRRCSNGLSILLMPSAHALADAGSAFKFFC